MNNNKAQKQLKTICPTCGTHLSDTAVVCAVCGTEIHKTGRAKNPESVQASRIPEITLSLPAAIGLLALFLVTGAVLVYIVISMTGGTTTKTGDVTATVTPTITQTVVFTEAPTSTPVPTSTTQPPFDYTVATGDSCTSIAVSFNVSVQSIIILNNLPAACNTLSIGQVLKVPFPTPTPMPAATNTLEPAQATLSACEKVIYTVQANDTLGSIAANYAVPADAIKNYNGLATDTVFLGLNLTIPLCEREATPGPTPTPTNPPPYPAANLLLPADGASFTLATDSITLQWASIGTLRENEKYMVVIEDVTEGVGRRLVDYVSDTKFIIPPTFRPSDSAPHIFRWYIVSVRQSGSDDQGQTIWAEAGELSLQRVFSWQGIAPEATPAQ
jgi:LysM repeat protein